MFILTLGSISALITFGCAVIETKNKKQLNLFYVTIIFES